MLRNVSVKHRSGPSFHSGRVDRSIFALFFYSVRLGIDPSWAWSSKTLYAFHDNNIHVNANTNQATWFREVPAWSSFVRLEVGSFDNCRPGSGTGSPWSTTRMGVIRELVPRSCEGRKRQRVKPQITGTGMQLELSSCFGTAGSSLGQVHIWFMPMNGKVEDPALMDEAVLAI